MPYQEFVNVAGYSSLPTEFIWLFVALGVWSLIWKGIALWKAARNGDRAWYIVLLVVNTAGILEILYTFVFGRKKNAQNV